MRLFLAILEGASPRDAVPVLASEDPDLIRAVAEALASRLGADQPSVDRILNLTGWRDEGGADA